MKQNTSIQDNREHAHTHIPEQHYHEPWLTFYFCPFSSESLKSYISIFLVPFQTSITIRLKENT